jgi:minor extracellular serine protease Vpr
MRIQQKRATFTIVASMTASIIAGVLTACSPNQKQGLQLLTDHNAIISTQPQAGTHSLFMIRLTEKAALATSTKADPKQLAAIDAEQTKLMKELAALSSDVKPLYKYRLVSNAVAVVAPTALKDRLKQMTNVILVESAGSFSRPLEMPGALKGSDFRARNSVKFIGGEIAHSKGLRGQGMRVGVIDTGIDYTHSMFGGAGTEAAYKAINPSQADSSFPSAKVVGGMDFVGTDYDSASADFTKRIPTPDVNPLDEGGHGTHVGGTIAGLGDGTNSYDGVAPDAVLFALKVFGAKGSTGDATVLAALEYAADPNGDGDTADHLDVVNLSLGGGFGEAHILYSEGVSNLSRGGTVVVASAGNSGDVSYIVGAPSVAEDAISVAASVDEIRRGKVHASGAT